MAKQKYIRTEYNDGNVVLSNIRKGRASIPVIGLNDSYTATKVNTWFDGSPMTPEKADGSVYLRLAETGEYFRVNLPNWGETFLQKPNVDALRNMSSTEILLIRMGYYKGVSLLGYYAEEGGDTPSPIQYYLSDTEEDDDGGSVFEVGGIKLGHDFETSVNSKYYGYFGLSSQTGLINKAAERNNHVILEGYCDLGDGISITKNNFTLEGVSNNSIISIQGNYAIRLNGDNCTIRGFNLDGANLTQRGLSINGDKPTIEHNIVQNILGRNLSASGISLEKLTAGSLTRAKVSNNVIRNIAAPYTGNNGEGAGSARGIIMSGYNLDYSNPSFIVDNEAHNILGREGDGIQILSDNGNLTVFENSYLTISGNKVSNCNRRYIKVQSSNVLVKDNSFENSLLLTELTNSNSGIGVINSNNVNVTGNKGDCTGFSFGISFVNDSTSYGIGNKCYLNNIDSGANTGATWGNPNSQRGIYLSFQDGIQTFSNTIGYNGFIDLINVINSNISNNTIESIGDADSGVGVNINVGSDNNIVEGNKGMSKTAIITYFVSNSGNGNKIIGNTTEYSPLRNYAVVRLSVGASENLVSNNNNSSNVFSSVTDLSGENNYIMYNNKGGGSGRSVYFKDSVPTSGNYAAGDIIFKSVNQVVSKNIGWICSIGSVSGNGGTWVPFGMIGIYQGSLDPNGNQDGRYGDIYKKVGSGATPINIIWIKTTDSGNTGWEKLIHQNILATGSVKGLVGQSAAEANITTADATDETEAIALVNELKAKINAILASDRASGQRAT